MTGRLVERQEVASAFGKTAEDFDHLLPSLYGLGFPKPVAHAKDQWLVIELLDWITEQQDTNIRFVEHLERWLLLPN